MHRVTSTIAANTSVKSDKRAYRRYIVNLKGECCYQAHVCSPIEIRDFCLGGMYLVYATSESTSLDQLVLAPTQGEIVEIRFTLPTEQNENFSILGRVVRSDMRSLGISFVQPNSAVLEKILNYALHYQDLKPINGKSKLNKKPSEAQTYLQLLTKIRAMAREPVKELTDAYLLRQSTVLLEMADKSLDISEQNAYFNALELFKKNHLRFKATFIDNISRIINGIPEAINYDELDKDLTHSNHGLSLVDDDAIDDWIVRSDISDKAETAYFDELTGIEQRLSVLFNIKIVKQNNPIGPEAFSRAFQDTLRRLNLGKTAYLICCKIFRDVLKDNVGEFYRRVNGLLLKHGILPELHYEIKLHEGAGKAKKRKKTPEELEQAQRLLDSIDNDKNLYDLISDLQTLKHGNTSPTATGLGKHDLLNAIAELSTQANLTPQTPIETGYNSLALQLLNRLKESPSGQQLSPKEASIMETTGSIYEALYKDNIITGGVKEWLREVELPLLQEAIRDESVLSDKSHIARSFINQLAKLELYNDESRDFISNSIKRTIEGLLQEVAHKEGMDQNLMSTLLRKVNALVTTQNKAYSENYNESQELCESQAPLPKLKYAEATINYVIPNELRIREWRKRIRRMQIGDWILFDTDSPESCRLKLAWISENFDRYVFVNMLGILEGEITVNELASLLDSSSAIFLENAEEPAVDRAQYSMLQKLHSQLMHETTHDHLTSLLNRREFERQMKKILTSQNSLPLSNVVCFFDVDYFDVLNSTLGYDIGDQLLIEIARTITEFFGEHTIIGKVGGNEFAVLLQDCTMQQAIEVVNRYKDQLSQYRFEHEDNRHIVTLGTGLVEIDLQQHEISRLLQTAEAACRLAKSKGVNCMHAVEVDDNQLQENKKIMAWASKIDNSMTDGTLVLRYQPIAPIADANLKHHSEILLGVTDETGAITSPVPFITAAERYRRMPDIDRWVVKNVIDYINAYPEVIDAIGGVAINLSGISVNDESFIPFILEQLERLEVNNENITFEITETAGICSLSAAAEFIKEIKKTGCSFSLDDFGTGMSTYSYLKNLPVDFIKIDGSFIRDIKKNESDMIVVKSIVEIGHFMNKQIIAECVENESIIETLQALGVDYVQGYAISKPSPLESITRTLRLQ